MNRAELRNLAKLRLAEAQTLLAAARWSGAYYLSGYSVECALKACIAKNTRRSDPLVRTLAIGLRTGPTDVGEIRFSNNVINGQVIEDAFIYRLAPPDPPVQGARPAASQ